MKVCFELEPSTSRHFVNKLTHSNVGLSKVQNQMRKKYFRIASGWIIWKYFFLYIGIHHTDSMMAAMQISKKYIISPYDLPHAPPPPSPMGSDASIYELGIFGINVIKICCLKSKIKLEITCISFYFISLFLCMIYGSRREHLKILINYRLNLWYSFSRFS